ncbi:TadE/TadG family type IV pilus assembly protein [Pararhodobacter zhoushanensis]|uniref:TadE/TadG family type IV pilus assembly protein n=1 Tax=Pararhodobacter zhoushanensis TaxID=2479545 RepID=UPI000F8F0F02|nr:hypothetical protein [Pararhodobacter zhoushanensis]
MRHLFTLLFARHRLTRLKDERGSVAVEFVITLPLLLWGLVATVVFFEGYKARYNAQMAAQTVADIMSRETDLFTGNYIEGLNNVFDFLADSEYPTRIRVSSVIWDSTTERNRLQWSYATRNMAPLPENTFELLQNDDTATLLAEFGDDTSFSFTGAAAQMPVSDLASRIPPVLPGEALLLVETFALWEPFASVGVGNLRFAPVVVVRPRFAPWINFEGVETIYPEASYEVAWTGSGNTSLPDPNDPDEPVTEPPAGATYAFENSVTTGFSSNTVTAGGPTGRYLGPFGASTYNNPVTLSVALPSANTNASIAFDLFIIDTWDAYNASWAPSYGDNFTLMYNGQPISLDLFNTALSAPFNNARTSAGYIAGVTYGVTMTRTSSGTNFTGSADHDSAWRVVVTLQNAPQNFTLGFSASVQESLANESFGIDNLTIASSGTGTPPPFTANPSNLETRDPHTRFARYSGCPEYRISAPWLTMTRSDLTTGITMPREAGGPTDASRCAASGGRGRVQASPHLVLNYDAQGVVNSSSGLLIRTDDYNNGGTCDTTLYVRDPNGQWWFNDDVSNTTYGRDYNSRLQIAGATSGQYEIWLGTYGSSRCTSDLSISRYTR